MGKSGRRGLWGGVRGGRGRKPGGGACVAWRRGLAGALSLLRQRGRACGWGGARKPGGGARGWRIPGGGGRGGGGWPLRHPRAGEKRGREWGRGRGGCINRGTGLA